jgi:nucleoside-diphosphate-sugar epimerase
VKDALKNNKMCLHMGGEIWRPLISVDDIAEIYVKCIESECNGIYNAVGCNIRISEVALRVYSALKEKCTIPELYCDYNFPQTGIRNYRVDGSKLKKALDFTPKMDIQNAVFEIMDNIDKINDFSNPVYYNIEWTKKYLQYWMK